MMMAAVRAMRRSTPTFCKLLFLPLCLLLAAYNLVAAADDGAGYDDAPEILIFTTTARIHPDIPGFTFHRIVGDELPEPWYELPLPREVNITIEDEDGKTIQTISDLMQSNVWDSIETKEITFDDFNFDGYLDMRLLRWRDGAGGLLANYYFWLWDAENRQFVLNQKLMDIEAAFINVNYDNQQIVAFNREPNPANYTLTFYEYRPHGEFLRVAHEFNRRKPHYVEITRTNYITGEVTVELHPFEEDIPADNPPDEIFMARVEINPDIPPLIMRLDIWEIFGSNELEHRIDITIWHEDGTLVQHIEGLQAWERPLTDMPFNLHFEDYNQDGYMDMGLWRSRGGSMRNMPHYFWLWDTEQGKFVANDFLTDLSWGGTVQLWEDGTVRSFTRGSSQHYGWTTFEYRPGEGFAAIHSLIHEWVYEWSDGTPALLHLKITEIDHISGIETITIEQMKN